MIQASFDAIKSRVRSIIDEKKCNEVNRKTDVKKAGIYMMYVDCFDDDRIIPFYIGQTNNFQERFKKHFSEILSLNRLDYRCYKYALLHGLYNGHYRPCKIFTYMVNHGCELKDVHMIVLEEIDSEKERLKKETEYINELCAAFVGFNQMNCVSNYIDYNYGVYTKSEFAEIVNLDMQLLMQYWEYGYNVFNWFLANGHFSEKQKEIFLSSVSDKRYDEIIKVKTRLYEIMREVNDIRIYNGTTSEKLAWTICEKDILQFFKHHGLKSELKQKLVVSILLFDIENQKKDLSSYLRRCKGSDSTDIIGILNTKYGKELKPIRETIKANQQKYRDLEIEKEKIGIVVYELLLPTKEYKSHPLKSLYSKCELPVVEGVDNICYINIEYTCFKEDYDNDFYPEICKIDYCIVKDSEVHSRDVFIKNGLDEFWNTDEIYYYEKGFMCGPFCIFLVGDVWTYIPVTMEYKNGINEYTMRAVVMEEDVEVFREIDALIDNKTKIVYTTSGYKSCIKRYAEIADKEKLSIVKRLIRMCK